MSAGKDFQLVRMKSGKQTFEVMTNPGSVNKYRKGELGIDQVLYTDVIFKNHVSFFFFFFFFFFFDSFLSPLSHFRFLFPFSILNFNLLYYRAKPRRPAMPSFPQDLTPVTSKKLPSSSVPREICNSLLRKGKRRSPRRGLRLLLT